MDRGAWWTATVHGLAKLAPFFLGTSFFKGLLKNDAYSDLVFDRHSQK